MLRPSEIVSKAVIDARENLARAMKSGDARRIEQSYAALESADRVSRARRVAMHSTRITVRILEKI